MRFYTNVLQKGNAIYVRGYENGSAFKEVIQYKPYLFVDAKTPHTQYRTIKNEPVEKIEFDSIKEARDFIKRYKDTSGFNIYGLNNFMYVYMNDEFTDRTYEPTLISVANIDIETAIDDRFPDPKTADQEITAITVEKNGMYYMFGCGEYVTDKKDEIYIKCRTEEDLLMKFLRIWNDTIKPDVITGWYIDGFDIPYLVNRINRVLGSDYTKKLSPWGIIESKTVKLFGGAREVTMYSFGGISILDYQDLYKKFAHEKQESYKLDFISHVELGERKIDYSEYESLQHLYENNFQLFMEYNRKDTELVKRLNDKLKYLELVYSLAYGSFVNYNDGLGTVKPWDVSIHNYLLKRNTVIPFADSIGFDDGTKIEGGFVKESTPGLHKWVVSFDATSLYPSLIMQYNISPETLIDTLPYITVDSALNGCFRNPELISALKEHNAAITPTGCIFNKDKQGFLPAMMEDLFKTRQSIKSEMLKFQISYEQTKNKEDKQRSEQLDSVQTATKTKLNAGYGAFANKYFRWFDNRLAESITKSGQMTIRFAEKAINQYMNKLLGTTGKDYVVVVDTDSCYVVMDGWVEQNCKDLPTSEIVEKLNQFCNDKFAKMLDKALLHMFEYTNGFQPKIKMKRECIADKMIVVAKKRYVMNILDKEGTRYSTPKLKVQGIEAVRSSTPTICREHIRESLRLVLNGSIEEYRNHVAKFKEIFYNSPFEDVAKPTGVSEVAKYDSGDGSIVKRTPIHVRAALVFNRLLKKHNLHKRYQPIYDGDKIKYCYLKVPNTIQSTVFGTNGPIPDQFDITRFIDYDIQFQKTFLDPIISITAAAGITLEDVDDLEDLFC